MLADLKLKRAEIGKAARNVGKKQSIESTQVMTKPKPPTQIGSLPNYGAASQVTTSQKKPRPAGAAETVIS